MFLQLFLGLGLPRLIFLISLFIFIFLIMITICLKIGLAAVHSEHNNFSSVFVTALLCALVGWIPCLGFILCWIFINARHDTGFLAAIIVWLIAFLVGIFIIIAIWILF